MKKCLLVIAMIGLVAAVNAQSSDANAKKVLDGVSSKFKTFKGVQANFTLQVEDARRCSLLFVPLPACPRKRIAGG